MNATFVDTGYYVAIIDRGDNLHDAAASVTRALAAEHVPLITSEHVLAELLTFMSKAGPRARRSAVEYVDEILADPSVRVVPQTSKLFERAMQLYSTRMDKQYSMTDCSSMVICRDEGITDVLSATTTSSRKDSQSSSDIAPRNIQQLTSNIQITPAGTAASRSRSPAR